MIREQLRDVLPESWRPYAKAVYALIIFVIGLLVSLAVVDDQTALKVTQVVTGLAMLLGVVEVPNEEQPGPETQPYPPQQG